MNGGIGDTEDYDKIMFDGFEYIVEKQQECCSMIKKFSKSTKNNYFQFV